MNNQKQFFNISLACDLMGKSIDQVLEQCAAFDPQLLTANSSSEDDYKTFQRLRKLADPSVDDSDIDDKLFFDMFDTHVGFNCHFELQDYQAFSYVGINFVNNTAVECIVSLGMPANPERYGSELEVTKVFLVSLEELYLNGRIQEESEPGTRVYTWKKDNRTVVSFISSPPSGSPKDTGALLSVQIRDTQLHPGGEYFALLYDRAQKSVQDVRRVMLNRKDEPLEEVYEGRSVRYHLTSFLMWTAIVLGIVGIISLVSKNFVTGTILIILAALCAFFMSKLHDKARRDYRQKITMLQHSTRRNEKVGDEGNSSTSKVGTAPVEAVDISPELEVFCSDHIEVLGRALNRAIRIGRKEYEAGFDEAMDVLSTIYPLEYRVPEKDRPRMLAEVKRYAAESIVRIPYNRLSPLNQFLVTIPPYVFYCLEKYLIDDPDLQEEARHLMNTKGFPHYLQENLGYPISQEIKGAFWRPNPLAFLGRLFGLGRRR